MFKAIFVNLLQAQNITAYKLSKETGIAEGSISRWRNSGELPSAENLVKIADYFGVSIDYLLGRTEERTVGGASDRPSGPPKPPDIILASGSPRRRELLQMLGVKNLFIFPAAGEERVEPGLATEDVVLTLSAQKALEVAARFGKTPCIVIGADTVVALDGVIFGKPKDAEDAARMLRALSGREHTVFTGLTLISGKTELQAVEATAVRFRALTDDEIAAYVRSGEPMDKAGAYGAQGLASLFVEGITGDFFNVMGLPLCKLGQMLKEFGVALL